MGGSLVRESGAERALIPVRIVLSSHVFAPSIGGIETVSRLLARALAAEGFDVVVVTQTPGPEVTGEPFTVVRRPTSWELVRLIRGSAAVIQNNFSFRTFWPTFLLRRPLIVTHQIWFGDDAVARLKRWCCCAGTNIAISTAIAASLAGPSSVIGNPYDDEVFRCEADRPRDRDLVFVGRLITDKGCDLLIDAVAELVARGLSPSCTVVGLGPERDALEMQARDRGVGHLVQFAGVQTGEALARILSDHKVLVVPSRWAEPFGVVALEGIACGCVVIGSSLGGLPDAIGACGCVFPNNDTGALVVLLEHLLKNDGARRDLRKAAPEHLARHTARSVARRYLDLIRVKRNIADTGLASVRSVEGVDQAR